MAALRLLLPHPSPTSDLFGDYDTTFTSEVAANLTWAQQNVLPSTDPTVIAGYTATYKVGTDIVLKSRVGQVELLMGLTGTSQGGDDSIAIQAGALRARRAGERASVGTSC